MLDLLANVVIQHGGNRPRINATPEELLRMDLRMFFHIYDRWRDDLDQWDARQDARRSRMGI